MSKQVIQKLSKTIFSGIQPTGVPHLGNYFGAIKNWVDLQHTADAKVYFCIVDLHALTNPDIEKAKQLPKLTLEMAATLLACGIDIKKAVLYQQSHVPEHSQLAWQMNCLASFGLINRMTQWKDKSILAQQLNTSPGLGLFTYPALQAADILLFKATHVPVGEDQRQHLELTRILAKKYNTVYEEGFFPLPQDLYTSGSKIQSLVEPQKKMSKSNGLEASRINLDDSAELIKKKIRKAMTDSLSGIEFKPEERAGISNLIQIMALAQGKSVETIADQYKNNKSILDFKIDVADAIISHLSPIQKEYARLIKDEGYLKQMLKEGGLKAREQASLTIKEVYNRIGLI